MDGDVTAFSELFNMAPAGVDLAVALYSFEPEYSNSSDSFVTRLGRNVKEVMRKVLGIYKTRSGVNMQIATQMHLLPKKFWKYLPWQIPTM